MMPEAGVNCVYLRRAYGRVVGFLYGCDDICGRQGRRCRRLWRSYLGDDPKNVKGRWGVGALVDRRWRPSVIGFRSSHGRSGRGGAGNDLTTVVSLINCASVTSGGRTALAAWTLAKVLSILGALSAPLIFRTLATGRTTLPPAWQAAGGGRRCRCTWRVRPASAPRCWVRYGPTMAGAMSRRSRVKSAIRATYLPRAFVGGMLVVGSLYLFVNLAYYYALTPLEIASVPKRISVATEVLQRFMGPIGWYP